MVVRKKANVIRTITVLKALYPCPAKGVTTSSKTANKINDVYEDLINAYAQP